MSDKLMDKVVYRRARMNGNSCTIAMPKDCAGKWYRREIDARGRVITFTLIPEETETKPSTAREEEHEN